MKKTLLRITYTLFLLIPTTFLAQTTLFNANFSNTTGDNNWSVSSTGASGGAWVNGNNTTYNNSAVGNYLYSEMYTTQYRNNTRITAVSPLMNFSNHTNISMTLKVWYQTEVAWDGMTIQYTFDNGSNWTILGTQNSGFYNDNDVDAIGNNVHGWAGNSNGWISKTINLSSLNAAFNNNSSVRLRIIFASNNTNRGTGVAFDELLISGTPNTPEIDLLGNSISITNGDNTPSLADHTIFEETDAVSSSFSTRSFTISNSGTANLVLSGTPKVSVSNPTHFTVTTVASAITSPLPTGNTTSFTIRFNTTTPGTHTSVVTISNNDSNEGTYTFTIAATAKTPLAFAPGGVNGDLKVWLRSDLNAGTVNGQLVSQWGNLGRHTNPVAAVGREPKYRDHPDYNINFNPVIDFDNATNGGLDANFTASGQQYLAASDGFYTQEMFVVVIPDLTVSATTGSMDLYCGNDPAHQPTSEDVTGIGFGTYTSSLSNEVITYAQNTSGSYRIADNSASRTYSNVGIINVRNNTAVPATGMQLYYNGLDISTVEVNANTFYNLSNTNYWIGRSETWTANTNARIAEIVNFSSRKDDATERPKIETYLAIKYGITLGTNGVGKNYIASDGSVLFTAASGFNYNISGIGRDDVSQLQQKQSRSVYTTDDITVGLGSIAATNSANTNTFTNNKDYLVWGHNNGPLTAQPVVAVNLSADVPNLSSEVTFYPIGRVWKLQASSATVGSVEIAIPSVMLQAAVNGPGNYFMFISDSATFDSNASYVKMEEIGNVVTAHYKFEGTKYITFGHSPQLTLERSITFDGTNDYLDGGDIADLPNNFTISAWIKREAGANQTIVSKRNNPYTEGYELKIEASGLLEMNWYNGSLQQINSTVAIPAGKWHHVAVTYDGENTLLYLDGVLDNIMPMETVLPNAHPFLIGAAAASNPQAFFNGGIDEVRILNTVLTPSQLRFIMNQEISKHADGSVSGKIIPSEITLNETSNVPWNAVVVYFPMSQYVFTNTVDESDNKHIARLQNVTQVDIQTAPLPYQTASEGDWSDAINWKNGTVQNPPNSLSIADENQTIDWNIVNISHHVNSFGNKTLLGLFINNATLNAANDSKIQVSHYLKLDGKIDLKGRSQLIQPEGSDIDAASAGFIERDQQGTTNIYNYNYWCSPVGAINMQTNNTPYTLTNVLKDGTNPDNYLNINWVTGLNGSFAVPIKIAKTWLYKFQNSSYQYANWSQLTPTTAIQTAIGFTMKGSGSPAAFQNYTFVGKPNNGAITVPVSAGNLNLTGNPYPSALDSEVFISDNVANGAITGAIYFWEHFDTNYTHALASYQGGYAALTAVGGTPPVYPEGISGLGFSDRIPSRFIPVGQGFFVTGSATGGNITFGNHQRLFVKENNVASNVMFRGSNVSLSQEYNNQDDEHHNNLLTKLRIGFNSFNNYHRQLLLGFMNEQATAEINPGFDGITIDDLPDDMLFHHNDAKLIIQADSYFNNFNVYPLWVKTSTRGMVTFTLDAFENLENDQQVFIYDAETLLYHNIKTEDFEILLNQGVYPNRFTLCFRTDAMLGTKDIAALSQPDIIYASVSHNLIVRNEVQASIEKVQVYNLLGQEIDSWDFANRTDLRMEIPLQNLSSGTYIVKLQAGGQTSAKKIIIE